MTPIRRDRIRRKRYEKVDVRPDGRCGGSGPDRLRREGDRRSLDEGTGAGIVDSGAFSDELDELDLDTACAVYGLDRQQVTDGFVRRSAGATCEEAAVLIFDSEDHAKAAAETLSGYVQDQIDQNRDYRPAEVPKLENKWLEQRGSTVLLVVANDLKAAQDAVK